MESEQYHKLYETIQNLDPKIRFVTIIDYEGRLLFGGQKEGVTDYLSPGFQKESLRHAMDAWKLRDKYSDFIGKGKYAIAAYEKIKRITIPLGNNNVLFISVDNTPLNATKGKSYGHMVDMGKIMSIVDL